MSVAGKEGEPAAAVPCTGQSAQMQSNALIVKMGNRDPEREGTETQREKGQSRG